jgi:uncharacterized repeat protein (TIGR02543 family)
VFQLATSNVLSVSKSGNGSGTVTSSPPGIDCGSVCSAIYAAGTTVMLTAIPTDGWVFKGWGGACSGTGTCTVTMNSSQNVTATFQQNAYNLSVSVIGSPGGRVTSAPAGIDCGSVCSARFSPGRQVTLTANVATGWGLVGWDSTCSGIAPTCNVTLNGDTTVSVTFATLFGVVAAPVVRDPTDTTALPAPIIGPNP